MREKYESLALVDLKEIAKARGIKGTSGMKKAEIIEAMLLEDEKEKNVPKEIEGISAVQENPVKERKTPGKRSAEKCSKRKFLHKPEPDLCKKDNRDTQHHTDRT